MAALTYNLLALHCLARIPTRQGVHCAPIKSSVFGLPKPTDPRTYQDKRLAGVLASRSRTCACSMSVTGKTSIEVAVGGKGGVTVDVYSDSKALASGLGQFLKAAADEAVAARNAFTLVLSGGSLVKILGAVAAEPETFKEIDWQRWHVFWADERVVPLDHPDSNYKGALDEFLSKVPIPSGQIHAINEKLATEAAAAEYETTLRDLVTAKVLATSSGAVAYPRFDVILLGMGPDGHCASLFPGHPLLQEKSKWVAPIFDSPKPPPERITLTYPVINAAANVAFVATGAGKAEQLKTIFGAPVTPGSLPAQDVYPENGKLVWIVDRPAAASL
eukprot:TRINITY_DN11276_c0_g1_i1.p1 TRINITY_DN11276_c0_g1~~TRINITY_DN11276_c0_g1_i1.p1  ORF type:complete len:332 (-),score=56.49 TRINITY_DN11276_c0_g1_i1:621-1616(-)